jgi:hypothetical protein
MSEELSNTTVTQWWWLTGPFLTILGTLVGRCCFVGSCTGPSTGS